jgi:phospholipase C
MHRSSKLLFCLLTSGMALAQFPPQIRNVVVIVQENRTPDNLFHFLTPACSIPASATGYRACIPHPVTSACYDVSPCGLSNQTGKVVAVNLTAVPLVGSADPDHSHAGFEHMCDPDGTLACRNDGAWQTAPDAGSYGYVKNQEVTNYDGSSGRLLDPYLTFAKQYGWANFMYQTNQGPSYPAHQFLFSGTSGRTESDDRNSIFVAENFTGSTEAGCLLPASTAGNPVYGFLLEPADPAQAWAALGTEAAAPSSTNCNLFDHNSVKECRLYNTIDENNVGSFCVTHNNMATTVLDPNSISWKYYAPSAGSIWTAPDAIRSICDPQPDSGGSLVCAGKEWAANVDVSNYGTDILRDIRKCKLSKVSWVIPNGAWSDHPSADPYGPSWVAAVINAIGNNPPCAIGTEDAGETYWQDTAIVVTWDDWGGWSDNQPANVQSGLPCVSTKPPTPCPGDYLYGFRVPLVVVSAYTPKGYINNEAHDFGSILRMIEGINGLTEGLMGNADARSSTDLHQFFTLMTPRPYKAVPAVKDANFFLNYTGAVTAPDND